MGQTNNKHKRARPLLSVTKQKAYNKIQRSLGLNSTLGQKNQFSHWLVQAHQASFVALEIACAAREHTHAEGGRGPISASLDACQYSQVSDQSLKKKKSNWCKIITCSLHTRYDLRRVKGFCLESASESFIPSLDLSLSVSLSFSLFPFSPFSHLVPMWTVKHSSLHEHFLNLGVICEKERVKASDGATLTRHRHQHQKTVYKNARRKNYLES